MEFRFLPSTYAAYHRQAVVTIEAKPGNWGFTVIRERLANNVSLIVTTVGTTTCAIFRHGCNRENLACCLCRKRSKVNKIQLSVWDILQKYCSFQELWRSCLGIAFDVTLAFIFLEDRLAATSKV